VPAESSPHLGDHVAAHWLGKVEAAHLGPDVGGDGLDFELGIYPHASMVPHARGLPQRLPFPRLRALAGLYRVPTDAHFPRRVRARRAGWEGG
jgi:hypothetical protein